MVGESADGEIIDTLAFQPRETRGVVRSLTAHKPAKWHTTYVARSRSPAPRADNMQLGTAEVSAAASPTGETENLHRYIESARGAKTLANGTFRRAVARPRRRRRHGAAESNNPAGGERPRGPRLDYGDDAAPRTPPPWPSPPRAVSYAQKHRLLGVVPPAVSRGDAARALLGHWCHGAAAGARGALRAA